MWFPVGGGLTTPVLVSAPGQWRRIRRRRRGARGRRRVPAGSLRSACRSSWSPSPHKACNAAPADYRTPLVILVVGQRRQSGDRTGAGVRVRSGHRRRRVVDRVRPGRCRRRLPGRDPAAAPPGPTRRPNRDEMAPLITAGRHLLLRVGSMLAVFTGATAIAARVDDSTLAAHRSRCRCSSSWRSCSTPSPCRPRPWWRRNSARRSRGRGSDRAEWWLSLIAAGGLAVVLGRVPVLPRVFTDDPRSSRGRRRRVAARAPRVPGAIAFADDGVLIGAGDYRFLGRAAFGYLVAMVPIAAVVLATPSLGIAGIWLGLDGGWRCAQSSTRCGCSRRDPAARPPGGRPGVRLVERRRDGVAPHPERGGAGQRGRARERERGTTPTRAHARRRTTPDAAQSGAVHVDADRW